jgi:uncharacterized protein YndB with AHSA1/START domain
LSHIEAEVDIDASPKRVWKVVADPRNLPLWDRRVAAVRDVPKGGLAVGTGYVAELRFMGAHADIRAHVLELDPPSHSKVRLTGIMDSTIETWIEPAGRGRSRLRHRVDYHFKGGALGEFAAGAVRMLGAQTLLKRGMAAQKLQAESEA